MPLIILCGIPCSGKSRRAEELVEECKRCGIASQLISDEELFNMDDRNAVYSDNAKEKNLRAAIKSNLQRCLSKDTFVIVDALNYIKGYRYEIYCISKSTKTTQCTLWCNTPITTAKEWNAARSESSRYSESVLDGLMMRFEPPDCQNRWENPLFTILPSDSLPCQEMFSCLLNKRAPPPNQSTQSQPLAGVNFLHELDRITQQVVSEINHVQQRGLLIGDKIVIPNVSETLTFSKSVSAAELGRLRRQFISAFKVRAVEDLQQSGDTFVKYLKNTPNFC